MIKITTYNTNTMNLDRMSYIKKIFFLFILFPFIIISCTTTNVKIRTLPKEGYDTYYNEQYIGKTPCGVEASNLIFKSHNLTLKSGDNKIIYSGKMEKEYKWANCCLLSWIYGLGLLYSHGPKEFQVINVNGIPKTASIYDSAKGYDKTLYRLAVLDFHANGVPVNIANNLTELIRTELIKTNRFIIIERSQIDQILKEQEVQQTGCTDINCAVQVGKIISANKILIGSIMKMGKNIVISGRIVDVEKGISEKAASETTESIDELIKAANVFSIKISESE